jgi:large repetitive protein
MSSLRERMLADRVRDVAAELSRLRKVRGPHRRTRRRIARAEAGLAAVLLLVAVPLGARAAVPVFFSPLEPFGLRGIEARRTLVELADLDGDGDLDAFLGAEYEGLTYAENTGGANAPAFSEPGSVPFGLPSYTSGAITAVDFDGDGDLDVVHPDGESLRVFINTGTPTAPAFAAPVSDPFSAPAIWNFAPIFADLDGDEDLDVLTNFWALPGFFHSFYFPNVGTAGAPEFRSPIHPFGLTERQTARRVLVDLDGDGDLDAVSKDHYDRLVLSPNTGTAQVPAFAAATTDPFHDSEVYGVPVFADLDGDGDLDLFTREGYDVVLHENTGSTVAPSFASPATGAFGLSYTPGLDFTFGDLDGDGDLDALVGCGNVSYAFVNTGTTTAPGFGSPVTSPFGIPSIYDARTPALHDFDGDGDLDLALSRYGHPTFVLENTSSVATPSFAAPSAPVPGLEHVFGDPSFGDLDGDGDLDALSTATFLGSVLFENTGSAAEPAFETYLAKFGLVAGFESLPALGDLDADGDLDALTDHRPEGLAVFENTGTATAPGFVETARVRSSVYGTNHLDDIDGDGDLDLFIATRRIPALFFENVGTPGRAELVSRIDVLGTSPYGFLAPALVDIDGDGDLDAFATDSGYGEPVFVENRGSAVQPEFAGAVSQPFGLTELYVAQGAFADLDADGDLDVLALWSGIFGFHENTGTASTPAFALSVTAPFGLPLEVKHLKRPSLADLDGDGDLDLVAGADNDTDVLYFENVGSAAEPAFGSPETNPFGLAGERYAYFALADLDGDGDFDALRGSYYGATEFLENTGSVAAPAFGPPVVVARFWGYASPALGDLDGDGDLDLLSGSGGSMIFLLPNEATSPACPVRVDPACTGEFEKALLVVDERKPGRERLRLEASAGPALAGPEIGDPLAADGTRYATCLYDESGELAAALDVDRAGESCGKRACWSPARGRDGGFAYGDSEGSEDGVRTLRMSGGARARFAVGARNARSKDQQELDRRIAESLAGSAELTVQVRVSDGACVSAHVSPFRSKPGLLKAK